MSKSELESAIEKHLRNECSYRGALVLKLGRSYTGFPDRCVIWPSPHACTDFIELKRPSGGRYEKLQLRWHAKLRAMGHRVEVLRTKEEVNRYVSRRKRVRSHATITLTV